MAKCLTDTVLALRGKQIHTTASAQLAQIDDQ